MDKKTIIKYLTNKNYSLNITNKVNIRNNILYVIVTYKEIKRNDYDRQDISYLLEDKNKEFSILKANDSVNLQLNKFVINNKLNLIINILDKDHNIEFKRHHDFYTPYDTPHTMSSYFAPGYFSKDNLMFVKNGKEKEKYLEKVFNFEKRENDFADLIPDINYVKKELPKINLNLEKNNQHNKAINEINNNRFINQLIYIENKEDYIFKYHQYAICVTKDNKFVLVNDANINKDDYKFIIQCDDTDNNKIVSTFFYTDKGYIIQLIINHFYSLDKLQDELNKQNEKIKDKGNIIFNFNDNLHTFIKGNYNKDYSSEYDSLDYYLLLLDKNNNAELRLIRFDEDMCNQAYHDYQKYKCLINIQKASKLNEIKKIIASQKTKDCYGRQLFIKLFNNDKKISEIDNAKFECILKETMFDYLSIQSQSIHKKINDGDIKLIISK